MVKPIINLKTLGLHILAFMLIFFVDNAFLILPIFLTFTLYFLSKKKYNAFLIAGIYSLCMGSELVYYAYSILLIVLSVLWSLPLKSDVFTKSKKIFSLLIIYLSLIYISQLFYNFSLLSFPIFIITFLSPIAIFFFIGKIPKNKISLSYILNNLLSIAIAQALIGLILQAIPRGISAILNRPTFGDVIKGTTGEAPDLAFLMLASILPFFLYYRKSTSKLKILVIVLFFVGMMILNDSKTYLYAIFLVFIFTWLLNNFFFNRTVVFKFFSVLMFCSVLLLSFTFTNKIINNIESKYGEYITGRYDAKSRYYNYSFDVNTRPLSQYIFGTGPGTNGSRASNALAYDVMYKKDNTVKLPGFISPHSSEFTRRYISGLYTEKYAEASNYRSAILGNPFNSICAIFVEFGMLGFILFFTFLISLIRYCSLYGNVLITKATLFIIFTNIIISFLDQSFETPISMHVMYLFLGLNLRKDLSL